MEVAGLVASVIAITGLAAHVWDICARYASETKGAAEDIKALGDKVEEIRILLDDLGKLLEGPGREKLTTTSSLSETLRKCQIELETLKKRIEPPAGSFLSHNLVTNPTKKSRSKRIREVLRISNKDAKGERSALLQVLRWPLDKSETKRILFRLNDTGSILQSALEIDQTRILLDIDLKTSGAPLNLVVADGASYGSYGNEDEPHCMENTREDILETIKNWALNPSSKSLFWLSGAAGTGKSTVARTVARFLQDQKILGGSFFFKRGDDSRSNASKFFSTLASNLSEYDRNMGPFLRRTLEMKPGIQKRQLVDQFEELLLKPLQLIKHNRYTILVIDALDESLFLERKFQEIKEKHIRKGTLPDDWPEDGTIARLVKMSTPLFIVAATISRFLDDHKFNPQDQLEEIFIKQRSLIHMDPRKSLYEMYHQIFERYFRNTTEYDTMKAMTDFQDIVGTIVLLEYPLSTLSLAPLIRKEESAIKFRLEGFHSVVHIPREPNGPVKIFHLSFREFLLSTAKDTRFKVDECQVHRNIATWCIQLLGKRLKRNICGLSSPGVLRSEVSIDIINKALPPEVRYASKYWAQHWMKAQEEIGDDHEVHKFLEEFLLEWLESTSLLGFTSDGIYNITDLEAIVSRGRSCQLSGLLTDIKRFMLFNRQTIEKAPLQVYLSALLFSPSDSIVKQKYYPEFLAWVEIPPYVLSSWSPQLLTLENEQEQCVWSCFAFAPDGKSLAARCGTIIRIWDCISGAVKHHFKIAELGDFEEKDMYTISRELDSLAYLPDGTCLIIGSSDGIYLWDFNSGILMHKVTPDKAKSITKITVFPNGELLASGRENGAIEIWSLDSWKLVQSFHGHTERLKILQISPNGKLIASVSNYWGRGIILWDPVSGNILAHLSLPALSEEIIASSSDSRTVCYNVETQSPKLLWDRPNLGYSGSTEAMVFLTDRILLVSRGELIQLIDIHSLESMGEICSHLDGEKIRHLEISPDRNILASLGGPNRISLWDMKSHDKFEDMSLGGLYQETTWLALSPDCEFLAAGCSGDEYIVMLWKVTFSGLSLAFELEMDFDTGGVEGGAFSPNGKLLATLGCLTEELRVWDTETGQEILVRPGLPYRKDPLVSDPDPGYAARVAFTADSSILAAALESNRKIFIFDLASRPPILTHEFDFDGKWVHYMCFSRDGGFLLLVSDWPAPEGLVTLWSTKNWEKLEILEKASTWDTGIRSLQNGRVLEIKTSQGPVFFDLTGSSMLPNSARTDPRGYIGISPNGEWITQNGENVLLVPPAFSLGIAQAAFETLGSTIGFAYNNRVNLMRFGAVDSVKELVLKKFISGPSDRR
ncbi:hypothetical protein H072_3709 [Dactylellina haptotyla CBS 200.50]|uniref:Nephrocystin 3-like N-terminal domain-containing protein n=1 Tax=Dactylellina haptotyla (strain CBS 200.50) TaxID=1284197 RepID=S8BS60_DACHA|nr:hypothetical protein H072_3709 [Dactylellina haptotyla CBS 200.50]